MFSLAKAMCLWYSKDVDAFGTLYREGGSSLGFRLIKLFWNESFRFILYYSKCVYHII